MKKLAISLSLMLVLILAVAPCWALADYNDHSAYSQFPLIEDGEELTVSVVTPLNDTFCSLEAKDKWFWIWSNTVTGIDFQVEGISISAIDEQKSMMLASNDLPDLMFGVGFSTDELIRYGQVEGQLLDLSPYINAETMPWLTRWFEQYPEAKAYCTTPKGAIYTIPAFVNYYLVPSGAYAVRYSMPELEETGLEVPTSVDEFTEVMYAIKENHPDAIPLGGSSEFADPRCFLLNSFGYLTGGGRSKIANTGANVAIKDNEVVIPAYDSDFIDYLTLMKQYYDDGIISKDFFTLDRNTVLAMVASGEMLSYAESAANADSSEEFYTKWNCYRPLTSEHLSEAATYDDSGRIIVGFITLSAACSEEKADKIMRYLDFFYSDLGALYLWEGPAANSADTLGIAGGYYFNEAGNTVYVDIESGKYPDLSTYLHSTTAGFPSYFGNRSHPLGKEMFEDHNVTNRPEMQSYFYDKDNVIPYGYVWENANGQNSLSLQNNVLPYFKIGYPAIVYYDEDTAYAINEYKTAIDPFIESEVAKFITGARSLDEFENFRAELKAMGVEDYIAIYQEVYSNFASSID